MKLSIITVVYNNRAGLEKTIASVIEQKKNIDNIEYIIIDGASTDGSTDVINNYSSNIDIYISEPDSGIYNAMNKGIRLATGDGLLFLNSGDYFMGDVLNNKITIPSFIPVKYINIFGMFRNRPFDNVRLGIPNCHQGIIFERKGVLYDENYTICADYKYYLDHKYPSKLSVLNCKGYVFFDAVGLSSKKINERDEQIFKIRKEYFGKITGYLFEVWPFTKRLIRFFLKKAQYKS